MKTAVLVVDMQKDFFTSERLLGAKDALIAHFNFLTDCARQNNVAVLWVRQEMKPDMSDAPQGDRKLGRSFVVVGTEGAQLLEGLTVGKSDREIIKTRYSPFYQTNLEELLRQDGIERLIVAGINTHACVRMAVIDAYQRDYEVILATDCINSLDEEHHKITVKYLSGKIAEPMTNPQLGELLAS